MTTPSRPRAATPLLLVGLASVLVLSGSAAAQWSATAGTDLTLAGDAWDQVQPKLARTADGFAYVSWFDSDPNGSPAFGYDVRVQRLDPAGKPQWGPNGVLVADRGYSSTQDYGLSVATDGSALLVFRDDRFASEAITAARVTPDGSLAWGVSGVQLTSTTDFLAAPKIAGTADGNIVCAWTQGSTVGVQKLDPSGAALWGMGAGLGLPIPGGTGTISASDLQATADAGAIVSFVHSTSFFAPRHLWALKLSSGGTPLWPLPGVAVFDGGSLQLGNFPTFEADGLGGGVFAWYQSSPSLDCRVQRVAANGTELFPHDGVPVATTPGQLRVNPVASYDPASGATYVGWRELNGSQSQHGFSVQKLDATGARQWSDGGVALSPLGALFIGPMAIEAVDGGASAAWFASPASFGGDQLFGARLDTAGMSTTGVVALSSSPSSTDDLVSAVGAFGDLQLAWRGDPAASVDILGQNLQGDGELGPAAGVLQRTGGTNVTSLTATPPALGTLSTLDLDVAASGKAFGALFVYLGTASLPFGTDVILVDVLHPVGELFGFPVQPGPAAQWSVFWPADPVLAGVRLSAQGVHIDVAPIELALSDAVDLYLGT